jgi:hypothetical protein
MPPQLLDCADEAKVSESSCDAWVSDPHTAQRRLGLEGNHGCGFRCSRPHPTAARCSLLLTVLIQIAGGLIRTAPDGGYWPVRPQWPSLKMSVTYFLKVSNFEQTIAVHICCFGNHRGIALSGPNATPPSIIGWVALCFPGCPNSLTFRK